MNELMKEYPETDTCIGEMHEIYFKKVICRISKLPFILFLFHLSFEICKSDEFPKYLVAFLMIAYSTIYLTTMKGDIRLQINLINLTEITCRSIIELIDGELEILIFCIRILKSIMFFFSFCQISTLQSKAWAYEIIISLFCIFSKLYSMQPFEILIAAVYILFMIIKIESLSMLCAKYNSLMQNYKYSFDTLYLFTQDMNQSLFLIKKTGIFFTNIHGSELLQTQLEKEDARESAVNVLIPDDFGFAPARLNNIKYKFGRFMQDTIDNAVVKFDIIESIFIYDSELSNSIRSLSSRADVQTVVSLAGIIKGFFSGSYSPSQSLLSCSNVQEHFHKSQKEGIDSIKHKKNMYLGLFRHKENSRKIYELHYKCINTFCMIEAVDVTDSVESVLAINTSKFNKVFLNKVAHEIKTPCLAINFLTSKMDQTLNDFSNHEELKELSNSVIKIYCMSELVLNQITENRVYLSGFDSLDQEISQILLEDIVKWGKSVLVSLLEYEDNKQNIKPKLNLKLFETHWIDSNERLLKIILGHTIRNAVKYTSKGEIEIGVEEISHTHEDITRLKLCKSSCNCNATNESMSDATYLMFYIKDSGVGLSKENLALINSPQYLLSTEDIHKFDFSETGSLKIGMKLIKSLCAILNIVFEAESTFQKETKMKFYVKYSNSKHEKESTPNNGGDFYYKNQLYDFRCDTEHADSVKSHDSKNNNFADTFRQSPEDISDQVTVKDEESEHPKIYNAQSLVKMKSDEKMQAWKEEMPSGAVSNSKSRQDINRYTSALSLNSKDHTKIVSSPKNNPFEIVLNNMKEDSNTSNSNMNSSNDDSFDNMEVIAKCNSKKNSPSFPFRSHLESNKIMNSLKLDDSNDDEGKFIS